MERNWILTDPADPKWQGQFPEVHAVTRQLLWNRNVRDAEAIKKFLNPSYEDLYDPFLFKDMEKVVARLNRAIEAGEKIFVYGDYDADGVPGAVIIKSTLDALGAVTGIYIPHREREGYGLNSGAIAYMLEQGGKIVITCDCGISNAAETAEAMSKGLEVIITDHHRIPEIVPKPFAALHPLIPGETYPNKFLTGGGVAFKLAQGLLSRVPPLRIRGGEPPPHGGGEGGVTRFHNPPQPSLTFPPKADPPRAEMEGENLEGFEKWLLDLVAISTVADVGKLLDENRTLVKYGLMVLNKTRRVGLQKLYETAGIKAGTLDTYSIGWQIAPRINAAGRMDHANVAFALLTTTDTGEAETLAAQLNAANVERQKATDVALKSARAQIGDGQVSGVRFQVSGGAYLLAAYDPSWNPGVIGLVAGRLMEEFRRPVLIGTRNEKGVIVASARSISEFNIVEALAVSKQYLMKFGGHPKAAGFSVESEEKWHGLIEHLQEMAYKALHEVDVRPSLTIDADISLAQVDWELVTQVQSLEPYGEGNPRPRFLLHGLQVLGFDGVGNNGKHLRLTVADDARKPAQNSAGQNFQSGKPQKMIGFNCGQWCAKLKAGDLIDTVVEVGVNEWNGQKNIELKIVDLRFHQVS